MFAQFFVYIYIYIYTRVAYLPQILISLPRFPSEIHNKEGLRSSSFGRVCRIEAQSGLQMNKNDPPALSVCVCVCIYSVTIEGKKRKTSKCFQKPKKQTIRKKKRGGGVPSAD